MLQLLMLLLAAGPLQGGTIGEMNLKVREMPSPTPVTDKDLRPQKAPDCRTEAETQRAVAQVRNGEPGECFVRDITAFNRYKG